MTIPNTTAILPSNPQQQLGAAVDPAAAPTDAAPAMHPHQPVNIDLPHWPPSAEADSDDYDSGQEDSNDSRQTLTHTTPVTRSRSAASSLEESSEAEDSYDTENEHHIGREPREFAEVFGPLLNGSNGAEFCTEISWMIEIKTPSRSELQSLTRAIATSTTLTCLNLPNLICKHLVAAVTEGMASNTSVHTLILRRICAKGDGALLARMLTSNHHLKTLDISYCSEFAQEDFIAIVEALRGQHNLQTLLAMESGDRIGDVGYGKKVIEALAANQSLQKLSLPYLLMTDTLDALGGVLAVHPTLVHLDLGQLPSDSSFAPALARAMTNAARLTTIRIDMMRSKGNDKEESADSDTDDNEAQPSPAKALFNAIAQCPTLTAVELVDVASITTLRDFLKANPRIRSVTLKDEDNRSDAEFSKGLAELLVLARSCNQLTHFSYEGESSYHAKSLLAELTMQTTINRGNHAQADVAGAGMSVMLDLQVNEPEAVPVLPTEIILQLANAVLENLTPADTKTVFDTVAPYAQFPLQGEEKKV
jgi:hypothetical protein